MNREDISVGDLVCIADDKYSTSLFGYLQSDVGVVTEKPVLPSAWFVVKFRKARRPQYIALRCLRLLVACEEMEVDSQSDP